MPRRDSSGVAMIYYHRKIALSIAAQGSSAFKKAFNKESFFWFDSLLFRG
jgi:hypothetical protein